MIAKAQSADRTGLAGCAANDPFPKATYVVKNSMEAERRYICDVTHQLWAG